MKSLWDFFLAPLRRFERQRQVNCRFFDYLQPAKSVKNAGFTRTNRIIAAQMDLCPHGRKYGSHRTPNVPHGSNFGRTNGKMAARNDFSAHGTEIVPHRLILRLRETIFVRTKLV